MRLGPVKVISGMEEFAAVDIAANSKTDIWLATLTLSSRVFASFNTSSQSIEIPSSAASWYVTKGRKPTPN